MLELGVKPRSSGFKVHDFNDYAILKFKGVYNCTMEVEDLKVSMWNICIIYSPRKY